MRRQRLLADGALAFLFEPVDAKVLRDTVAAALDGRGRSAGPSPRGG